MEEDSNLSVSEFTQASPKAKVHCVVTSLSPMKESRGRSYFQGEVSDGKLAMRVYGYDPELDVLCLVAACALCSYLKSTTPNTVVPAM